jgi:hypothetical protein
MPPSSVVSSASTRSRRPDPPRHTRRPVVSAHAGQLPARRQVLQRLRKARDAHDRLAWGSSAQRVREMPAPEIARRVRGSLRMRTSASRSAGWTAWQSGEAQPGCRENSVHQPGTSSRWAWRCESTRVGMRPSRRRNAASCAWDSSRTAGTSRDRRTARGCTVGGGIIAGGHLVPHWRGLLPSLKRASETAGPR